MFRADRFPEIVGYLRFIMLGVDDCGLHIQQVTDQTAQFLVEVEEELVFLFEEGADVVLIILEEWTLAIGGEERIPVDMAPVGVVGDADIFHRQRCVMVRGDGEREGAVGGRDDHTVAIGLLDKALVALYQAFIVAVQLLIPLDGTEICGGKKGFQFTLNFEIYDYFEL